MAGRMKRKPETSWAVLLSEVEVCKSPPKGLEATIVSGSHLPKMDRSGLCDPVAQFEIDDGQTISKVSGQPTILSKKQKRMLASELETSVMKQTLDPVWNESFMISFADEENPGRLTVSVHDYDVEVMKSEYIGEIKISCEELEAWLVQDLDFEFDKIFPVMRAGEQISGEDKCPTVLNIKFKIIVDTAKQERIQRESQNALRVKADAAVDEPLVEGELLKAGSSEGGKFRSRIVRLTNTYISYHVLAEAPAIDKIMFEDIVGVVCRASDRNELEFCFRPGEDLHWEKARAATLALEATDFVVCTSRKGAHRGRQYQFRTSTMLQREHWLVSVGRILQRYFDKPVRHLSVLQISRRRMRWFYMGDRCQICVACLIMLNFVLNIVQANFPNLDDDSTLARAFNQADLAFTCIFTIELSMNLYATLVREFFGDYWNWFDVTVVVVSLMSVMMDNLPGASALRLMRCFRVFRLFKRIPSLRQIVVSLSASIPSMLNALFIVLLFMAIYSIIAVNFFGFYRPDLYGNFVAGLFTMFQVLTGDAWSDVARSLFDLTGNPIPTAIFFISYMLTISLVLINVVVAVLLDEFGKAADGPPGKAGAEVGATDVFDRIAYVFSSYRDGEELQSKITALFRRLAELVQGHSGPLSAHSNLNLQISQESTHSHLDEEVLSFEGMREGLKQLGLIPPILFQRSDWNNHIVGKGLAHMRERDSDMVIGLAGFQTMMKDVVRSYNIRNINNILQTGHLNSMGDESIQHFFQGIKSLAILDQSVTDRAMKLTSRCNIKKINVSKLNEQLKAIQTRLDFLENGLAIAKQKKQVTRNSPHDSFRYRNHVGNAEKIEAFQEISVDVNAENAPSNAGHTAESADEIQPANQRADVDLPGANHNGEHGIKSGTGSSLTQRARKGNVNGTVFTPIFASPLAPFQKLGESLPPLIPPGNNSAAAFGVTAPAVGWSLWGTSTPAPAAAQPSLSRVTVSTGALTRRGTAGDSLASTLLSPFGWSLWGAETGGGGAAPARITASAPKESNPLGNLQEGVSNMFSGFLGGLGSLGLAAAGPKRVEPACSLSRRHGPDMRDRRISVFDNPGHD